jgi:PAS domain S-box-containing protein
MERPELAENLLLQSDRNMQLKPFDFKPTHIDRIKALTEELTADDEAVNMFFRLSLDLLMVANQDGDIIKANDAWSEILGFDKQEIIGSRIFEYVHLEDIDNFVQTWHHISEQDWERKHYRVLVHRKEECSALEWNATVYNGLVYAIAREVPLACVTCPESVRKQKVKRSSLRMDYGS